MVMQLDGDIIPVLLSAGEASPFWPLSRETYPKVAFRFWREDAVAAVCAACCGPVVICRADCGRKCRASLFIIDEQLREIGTSQARIVLEPFGRGAASAIAGLLAARSNSDAIIWAKPVDHWVGDLVAFRAAIADGLAAARQGRLVYFAFAPAKPEPRNLPLNLIEVQSGAYLSEDDIVRIQDSYHRV